MPEYGLVAGLVAVVSIGAVRLLGDEISESFASTTLTLASGISGSLPPADSGGGGGGSEPLPAWRIESEDLGFPAGGMVLTYNTTNLTPDVYAGPGGATIHWPDGTTTNVPANERYKSTHIKGTPPSKVVITGDVTRFAADPGGSGSTIDGKLMQVNSFGNVGLTNLFEAFRHEDGLTHVAPLPSTVTNLQGLFIFSNSSPTGIENWDISNVEILRGFSYSSTFNSDISGWDISNVPYDADYGLRGMFNVNSAFSHDLSGWCNPNYSTRPDFFDDGSKGAGYVAPNWANNSC